MTAQVPDASSARTPRAPARTWPPARADAGPYGWVVALAAGAVLGGVTLIIPALLSDRDAFSFLAVLLALIAGVYLGYAIQDGRPRAALTEEVGIVVFAVLATVALSTGDAVWLAAGLFGHALWDAVHHPRGIDTAVAWWYVPLCIGFDVVVGVYVLLRF